MDSAIDRQWVTRLTPPGSGGVAVLLVEGDAAVARLRQSFSGVLPEPGKIAYGVLRDFADGRVREVPSEGSSEGSSEVLDEVLVVSAGPSTEGTAPFELHVHGSPFVVAEIIERLDPGGSQRGASPQPFRRRAEALVHTAPSTLGARILMDQAAGAMDRALASVRGLALGERGAALQRIVRRGQTRLPLFEESAVALIGPVNAGKSTLFNVLVGANAASVSSEAGTTRDALLEHARIGPWPVRFLDTAGERDLVELAAGGDRRALVEQAGQRIALELAERADLVLRLMPFDGAAQPAVSGAEGARPPEVALATQAAAALGPDPLGWPAWTLSAQEAPEHARAMVLQAFEAALGLQGLGPLWVPGEAVPFDRPSLGMLEDAAKLEEVDDRTLDALSEQL